MNQSTDKQYFDVGIVLVHGIGEHRQGETLLQFGEPLLECLHARVLALWEQAHRGAGKIPFDSKTALFYNEVILGTKRPVYIDEATPMPLRRLDAQNAFAQVRVSVPRPVWRNVDGEMREVMTRHTVRWKVVESWWGEQVIEPHAPQVIGWMFTRGPWIATQFFYERNRYLHNLEPRGPVRNVKRWLRVPFYSLVAWLASLTAQIGLVIFAVGGLIPVANRWIAPLLLKIAGVLGDAYVLIVQDVQHAAIIGRLRATFEELRGECKTLVAVPHSQGSGVAFDTLTSATPSNSRWTADHVITFGSGVAKLKTLFYAETREPWSFQAAGWAPLGATIAASVAGVFAWVGELAMWLGVVLALCAGTLYYAAIFWRTVLPTFDRCLKAFQHKSSKDVAPPGHPTWTDFFTSHDPVPMSALTWAAANSSNTILGYAPTSYEVVNEGSWLADHVTYVNNKLEFCLPIVDKLMAWSSLPAPKNAEPARNAATQLWFRRLAQIRGVFEHFAMYTAIALLPYATINGEWEKASWVKKVAGWVHALCADWLPKFASNAIPSNADDVGFVRAVSAVVAVLLYAFALVNLSHLQQWWRSEFAVRRMRESPLSERQMRGASASVFVLYALAFLAFCVFFTDAKMLGWLHWCVGVALAAVTLLVIGWRLANRSSDVREVEFNNARDGLGVAK